MENKSSLDILSSVENGMLKIVLNRPKKKNAITISMYKTLCRILSESKSDNRIYAVTLTGTGNIFSSGNDFSSSLTDQDKNVPDIETPVKIFREFVNILITYPKLLIAIVNGPAVGIAVTMLPLFDLVYASNMAYFQTPFTSLGLTAEGCSTYTFPKIFGQSKAGDMLYLGYRMSAYEAKQYGLISEVYKHECLDDVWSYLNKLTKLSSESILAIKQLVKKWNQKTLLESNIEETTELLKRLQSSDFIERFSHTLIHKSKI